MTTPLPPGWYDDPRDPNAQRWWDGQKWAPYRQRRPEPGSAPPGVSAPVPAPAPPPAQQAQWPPPSPGTPKAPNSSALPPPPPQQPQQPQPAMPTGGGPSKRSRKPIVIAVVVGALAACAAAGVVVVHMLVSGNNSTIGSSTIAGSSAPTGSPLAPNAGSPATNTAPGGTNSAPTAAAPSPTSSANVTSGILTVDTSKNNQRTYGFIDPTSGQYSQVALFNIPTNSQGIPYLSVAASPDLTKFAMSELVEGQEVAGWIDTQGNFTNVTPPAASGAFSGVPPSYIAVGFDGAGSFYYREQSQGSLHPQMFELAAGSTTNPQEITSTAAQEGTLNVYLNYDGSIHFGCNPILSWLGPNTQVFVAGGSTQIDKRQYTHTDVAGCFDQYQDTPLLPTSNAAQVADAVGKPDGTMVAFKYDDRAVNGMDLYTVAADGSAQPTKVNTNLTPGQLAFKTLLRWVV
jgi:hypothetical protein